MLSEYNIEVCNKDDIYYPAEMKKIINMPRVLYYKGNIEIINAYKNIAIIGSRKASREGLKYAYEAGRTAALKGINVVNGLALGCDTEALRGALAENGKCVAVMPAGLDQIVPKSNCLLAEEILEKGGCLVSQYPIGTPVKKYQYVERDYIQSGISQGVVVIESQEDGGTMHAARHAVRQNRRLACYHSMLVNGASGNKQLSGVSKTQTLKSQADLILFLDEIGEEILFEQISLNL